MTITKICDYLRSELFMRDYEYGFYISGIKYKPNVSLGFDKEYFKQSITIYRVQRTEDTKREKIGTCIDACMLMKEMLRDISVEGRIWLICHREKGSVHTILSFDADGKTVYLELTPQSSKPWYGKEIVYDTKDAMLTDFDKNGYDITDVTEEIIIGEAPMFLISRIK